MKAPDPSHLELERNQRSVLRWAVATLAAVLIFSLAVSAIVMWRAAPSHSVVLNRQQMRLPPEPRLQEDPGADWRRYLGEQRRALDEWTNAGDGHVRIPIDDAIEIMSERGGWRDEGETQ